MQDPATTAPKGGAGSADELVERLFAWRRGFNAMHVIDLGIELGLFGALARAPGSTPAALAAAEGLHAPYVAAWCTAALGLGLLDAQAGTARDSAHGEPAALHWPLRLGPQVEDVVARPSHPRYLGGYVQLGTRHAAQDFAHARQAMRDGSRRPFQGRDASFAELIAQSLAGVNLMVARKVLPGLPEVATALGRGGALLDVGCGQAALLGHLSQVFPEAVLTGIDTDPTGLAAARQRFEADSLAGRIRLVEGDLDAAIDAGSQDVVSLVEVLHEMDPGQRPAVLRAVARVLRPGGCLVVVDETHPSSPAQAREAAYQFPIQTALEEMVWGNVVPTAEEQAWLLDQAGLEPASMRRLLGAGFTLLVARKPG